MCLLGFVSVLLLKQGQTDLRNFSLEVSCMGINVSPRRHRLLNKNLSARCERPASELFVREAKRLPKQHKLLSLLLIFNITRWQDSITEDTT